MSLNLADESQATQEDERITRARALLAEHHQPIARSCIRLGAVVAAAQTAPPVPDARSQRFWAMTLTNLETAAADCQAGISAQDASMLNQMNASLVIASNDLAQVLARFQALRNQG